ncbi:MAG: FdhF/YdeP family oxidoreductase [Verrucomicrobiales bacterium]|nr:FdhF/YdeP family oxidoreductase [bacterium]MDF2375510.1 FdhF/YdeP family oxidoreductase [Verrucomicrobiales bacterium]
MNKSSKESDSILARPPATHTGIKVKKPKSYAAGVEAVTSSFKHVFGLAGLKRGAEGMAKLNQTNGFDCPSCAWPDPDDHRASTEFCENGAKAMASETTKRRVDPAFFRKFSVEEISQQSDYWMEQQGRITDPMVLKEGASHYEPVSWDEAFHLIAEELNGLPDPDEAIFYTSGRTVNESAFLYGLFVRMYGTNNLPDCSNMCHESSGAALGDAIGIGKGTVSLKDIEEADCVLVVGQNPGTNHPRMLSALQETVRNGGEIIAVNPMKEAGLIGFAHPQEITGMMGASTPLSSEYLRVKINGDQALFQGLMKSLFDLERESPGEVIDPAFIDEYTTGFEAFVEEIEAVEWAEIELRSGIDEEQIRHVARRLIRRDKKLITCWAMGLTQHRNAVSTIRDVTNLHLMLGAIGKPGAGLCPVRGHSNVQGDRTMGIFEKMPAEFHDSIDRVFKFESPRKVGYDVVNSILAMHAEKASVFFAMGGNFLQATPDTDFTAEALRKCSLTVHVSTKLNRSHVVTGKTGLILPCLGRSEADLDEKGELQFSTVENSMGVVHQSQGTLEPASPNLLSEIEIAARLATATLGEEATVDFRSLAKNYDRVRDLIEETIPGFENFNERVREPGGFYLENPVKRRIFPTASGKAEFSAERLTSADLAEGELMLMTIRSHDQFNTTVYGLHDRYRGISNERRILFMNPDDMKDRGIGPLQEVSIRNETGGRVREVDGFLAIPYELPRDAVAGYFPELNPLVPIESTADISNTPTSKSIPVTVYQKF